MDFSSRLSVGHPPIRTPPLPESPRLAPASGGLSTWACPPDQIHTTTSIYPPELGASHTASNNYTFSSPSRTLARSPSTYNKFNPSDAKGQENCSDDGHSKDAAFLEPTDVVANTTTSFQDSKTLSGSTTFPTSHSGSPESSVSDLCLLETFPSHLPLRTHRPDASNEPTDSRTSGNGGHSMASGPYGGNKRPADDDADTAESQSDDEHQGGGQGGGGGGGAGDNTSSKQAQSAPGEPMSCPYRKRNRGRFNVRDHLVCTKVFNDLSIVKLHVREYHRRESMYKCHRCGLRFQSQVDLTQHQMQRCIATETPQREDHHDPEDGITADMLNRLIERKVEFKISTWKSLWELLFPDDTEIPSPEHSVPKIAEMHEYAETNNSVRLHATESFRLHAADIIRNGNLMDPETVVSQLVVQMDADMQESQADGLRDLDYKILKKLSSRSTALGRSRSAKTNRGQRAASSAIPVQPHGNEQKQRQANRRLAPNRPRNAEPHIVPPSSPSFAPYPALQVPLQPQGYLGQGVHTSQAPSMTNPQAWSAYTTQATAAIASPAQIQHSTQLEYMTTLLPDAVHGGSARHIFPTSAQQGQSPGPPIPGTYPVTRPASTNVYATHRAAVDFPSATPGPSQTRQQGGTAAYGPHSAGYYHAAQDGFNGWADNVQNRE